MKLITFPIITVIPCLLAISGFAQNCDSLFLGGGEASVTANVSPSFSGGVRLSGEFLYGKLEVVASSSKWASSIGFETYVSEADSCREGIILSNGMLAVFKNIPNDCSDVSQFKKLYPVPGWELLKHQENKYTFIWREDEVDLLVNDTLIVPHDPIPRESIPNQPMRITFRTNINLEFEPAGVIDTIKTSYLCYSFLNTTSVLQEGKAPLQFQLSQNYPNPFNPATNVEYYLPKASVVSLYITNSRGQRIRTLVNSEQRIGRHTTRWNGKDDFGGEVASGLYFLRMTADGFFDTKKLLLIR